MVGILSLFVYSNNKIIKDLGKVNFDFENSGCTEEDNFLETKFIGFQTLSNGFSFLGCNAGGDWEHPVFFIIYYDGKSFRGYVPEKGNTFNKYTKTAFGSEGEFFDFEDEKNLVKQLKKIFPKEAKQIENHNWDNNSSFFSDEFIDELFDKYNINSENTIIDDVLIEEDIKNRIKLP